MEKNYYCYEYKEIKYEVENKVLTITLNRPDKLNAFTNLMSNEIVDALNKADEDDNIRAIIFTGSGKTFCAGLDLDENDVFNENNKNNKNIEEYRDIGGLVSLRLYDMKKPIIAAINGSAVGVGITMTLPMDIRLASKNAKIGFVFNRRGIVNEACSSYFLPRVVGISKAMEWTLSGKVFSAKEALEGQLVNKIVPSEELLINAKEIARVIVDFTAPVSCALVRQMMWKMLGANHPMEAHEIESRIINWIGKQPDAVEGIRSFKEKRNPRFSMNPSKDMPEFYPWWTERKFRNL